MGSSSLLGPGSGGTLAPAAVSPKGGVPTATSSVPQKTTRKIKRKTGGGGTKNSGGGGKNKGGGGNRQPKPGDAYNLDLPTTPQDTKSYVDSLIRLTYGPQTNALQTQLAKQPHYFDAYRTQLGQLGQASDARYQTAIQGVGTLGQQLGGYAGQVLGQVQGQGVTGQAATDIANAGVVQQGQLGNWGGQLASHGAAMGNWYGQQQAISTPLQMEIQRGIKQALIDLKGEKGAARQKVLGELRDDRQQQRVDEAAAAALAGKSQAEIAEILAGIRNDRRDDRRANRENRQDRREHRADREAENQRNREDNQTSRSNTRIRLRQQRRKDREQEREERQDQRREQRQDNREQRQENRQELRNIKAKIETWKDQKDKDGKTPTLSQIRARLISEDYDIKLIRKAFADLAVDNAADLL